MTARIAHTFDDELARLDACATADAIRSGELDRGEVVAAAIERARKADVEIHAVATEDYDRAQRTASAAASKGAAGGAFVGVPTFIKDMTDVAGIPTRSGSAAFATAGPATKTGEIAQQLFDMGMTCLGKSTLPEFGFTASTEFPTGEPTRNPWNLDRSAGGSSGGSAALVAAGVVPIAHGGDGGGSIRLPASCCGLVGLKATRGRLAQPRQAKLLPVDITVEGVLTRSVRDTALFFAEAERRHKHPKLRDIGHVTAPIDRPLTIGVIHDAPIGIEVDEANRRVLGDTIALLEGLGHRTDVLPMPVGEQFAADFTHYWAMLAFSVRLLGDRLFDPSFDKSRLSDLTNGLADRFRADIAKTPGVIRRIRRSGAEHARLFDRYDLILSPTVAHLAPELGYLGMDLPFDVLFPRVEQWVGFTPLANATGAPSITLPLGHDAATNLPVGMMFGAAHGHEELLLALALQLEAAAPWPCLGDAGA